jgi:UDP-N-acetyl-D-glucosamine dehydrogenase
VTMWLSLVILESTTYPGTTDEEIRPILEAGGMQAGKGYFWLVFSPGADRPGQPELRPKNTPKVIFIPTTLLQQRRRRMGDEFVLLAGSNP